MRHIQTEWILLIASVAAFFGVGVSIALMTLDGYIPGVIFWICLLVGIVLQVLLSFRCRELRAELGNVPKHLIGLQSFCKNIYGLAADAITVIALIAFILACVLNGALALQLMLLGLLIFSFSMHCIGNGNNLDILMRYAYKKHRFRVRRETTQGGTENE